MIGAAWIKSPHDVQAARPVFHQDISGEEEHHRFDQAVVHKLQQARQHPDGPAQSECQQDQSDVLGAGISQQSFDILLH